MVLPTPPLRTDGNTVFPPSTAPDRSPTSDGANAGRHLNVDRCDARHGLNSRQRLIPHLIFHRTGGSRELDCKRHLTTINLRFLMTQA